MNDAGVANRAIFIKWEDLKEYNIVEVKIGIFPAWFRKRVYCFGQTLNDTFAAFDSLDPRTTIFFFVTPKILAELQRLSDGKSEAVNHIFSAVQWDIKGKAPCRNCRLVSSIQEVARYEYLETAELEGIPATENGVIYPFRKTG